MNYIKHLTGFFEKVATDKTLNPTHVSLYIALFQFWNCNRFKNPISISRDEVMRISKISSKATYHKCLKNLHSLGYINYEPSYNPFRGSHVYLFNFSEDLKPLPKSERRPKNEPISEQVLDKPYTGSETSTEQAVAPSLNNTNIPNKKNVANLEKLTKSFEENENDFVISTIGDPSDKELAKQITSQEKKFREKKKGFIEPNFQEIKTYFQENNFPEQEAQKFFNYFKSVGWLVGGKTPMVDWQAAAQNWILNSINFKQNSDTTPVHHRQNLNTTIDKDYSEPL